MYTRPSVMPQKKKRISKKTRRRPICAPASKRYEWPPVGSIQLGPYILAAGEYWVGDLYNVLNYELCEELGTTNVGFKKLSNGRDVVHFKLPDGSGIYAGKHKDQIYFIDSDTIGITLLEGLGVQARATGNVVVYTDKFECMSINVAHPQGGGNVSFNQFGGNVEIDSDDQVYSMTPSLRERLAVHKFATRLRGVSD